MECLYYKAAGKLVGTWVAYNIKGRTIDAAPMQGAGLTVVSLKPHWWAADSAVLDVRSEDINASTGRTRKHDGTIVLDPANPWLATRIDRYADSNEISQQRLEIDPEDCNTVYIFSIQPLQLSVMYMGNMLGVAMLIIQCVSERVSFGI